MSRVNKVVVKPCCKVCKDAGKSAQEYGNHWPKDKDGVTVCPTLLSQECRYCHQAGHTVKYCKVLEKDNALRAKRERLVERAQKHAELEQARTKASKPTTSVAPATGRFAMLMDDDDSDESPRSPKRTQKKALAPLKEEYPALGGSWRKSSVAPEVAKKISFMEMAVKPKEVALAEKQTREEERLGRAIATGMVIIERGSQGVVMTHPPKTQKQMEMERKKAVHQMECFKGLNGKGWADMDSDDEEEEALARREEDAW
jgi:hypothetical protein